MDFEKRKRDHIEISLSAQSQAEKSPGFERVELIHEALPEIDFSEVQLQTKTLNIKTASPFFVSSMTLGHEGARTLNNVIASVCEKRGMIMALGSQRRQLTDKSADVECRELRRQFPSLNVLGNLGLSQLITASDQQVCDLVGSLEAQGLIVHTNPLQECIQPEGTPQFRGGLEAIERVASYLKIPVIVKETGCGFSKRTFEKLAQTKIAAVDISGCGGTHWGRVESVRAGIGSVQNKVGETFKDWGVSTLDSLYAGIEMDLPYELWASGGVRSGLDGAKLLAMGAQMVGLARPILQQALNGEQVLEQYLDILDYELKTAMFCTGVATIDQLRTRGVWTWI